MFQTALPAQRPRVAVIDNFTAKTVDVDGDGVDDLSHGEIVERYIQARLPQADLVRFALSDTDDGVQTSREIGDAFESIRKRRKAGERFDAVNLSNGRPAFLKGTTVSGKAVTAANLAQLRKPFMRMLRDNAETGFRETYEMIRTVQRAMHRGGRKVMDTYISAGNNGPDVFNMHTLAKGATVVKATDAHGRVMNFSADNTLATRAAQGIFAVSRTNEGFDITNDGITDVLNQEVSGGQPLAERFIGKPVDEVLATDDEIELLMQGDPQTQKSRVASLHRLVELGYISPAMAESRRDIGEYVVFHQNAFQEYLKADENGRLVLNPDNAGMPNAIHTLRGTSYATPLRLAEDLRRKFSIDA